MTFARGLAISGVASTALLALVASYILGESRSSTATLYCTSDTSSASLRTLNASLPHAKCFRTQNGYFTEVLSEKPIEEQFTSLDGHVFPGIIESHGHILQYGEMLESVSLYGAESVEEVRIRVKEWLGRHKGEGYGSREKWIRGIGWDQAYFGGIMPTAVRIGSEGHAI